MAREPTLPPTAADKKKPAIEKLPWMGNIFGFAMLAVACLASVLTAQALTETDFGEAEWGLVNLVLGQILGYGSGALQLYMNQVGRKAPKEE